MLSEKWKNNSDTNDVGNFYIPSAREHFNFFSETRETASVVVDS